MERIPGRFKMMFVGRPDGKLMKGAPGNYEHGKVYSVPLHYSKTKFWKLLDEAPKYVAPDAKREDSVFQEASAVVPPDDGLPPEVSAELRSMGDGVIGEAPKFTSTAPPEATLTQSTPEEKKIRRRPRKAKTPEPQPAP